MKKLPIELKWALIISGADLVWTLIERILGWHSTHIENHENLQMYFLIPLVLLLFFALREKRLVDWDDNMTWMEGLRSGFVIAIFVTLLTPLVDWLSYNVISPDYFENFINDRIERGYVDDFEEGLEEYGFSRYAVLSSIGHFFSTLMLSALASLFAKRT